MSNLLEDFWIWANTTPRDYAEKGLDLLGDKPEFYFPFFDELLDYARRIIEKDFPTDQEIDDVITIMALDNENEEVLSYIEEFSSPAFLKSLIEKGLYHLQPEARWQIAELLYRRKPDDFKEYLKHLSIDSNDYVMKRAKNCLRYLGDEKF